MSGLAVHQIPPLSYHETQRMPLSRVLTSFVYGILVLSQPLDAQTFIYSGREYLKEGRSWYQIREMDLATGRRVQLTATPHNHWRPWCAPDGRSILFTSSPLGGDRLLSRFDRITKKETPVITLEQDLFEVVDALDNSNLIVQEYGGVIEIIDITANRKVRRISGVSPALSPNRKLVAWQTPVDILASPKQKSHVLLSDIAGDHQIDLGEGAAPVFLPDDRRLLFARFDSQAERFDLVRYNTLARNEEIQPTKNSKFGPGHDVFGLSVSSDGNSIVLATDGGRYGSAQHWRLVSNAEWMFVEENLGAWGGWSPNGWLIYATDGRDLRTLDAKRTVWGSDIKLLDQRTGEARTVVSGVSMNQEPRWCGGTTK